MVIFSYTILIFRRLFNMLELKVQDLRLRGCGFTLFPAAKEYGVNERLMDFLLSSIYIKLGLCSGDYDKEEEIKKKNPNILDTISEEDLTNNFLSEKYSVNDLLDNGLVTKDSNNLVLTQKSISILKRASEIQNKLDDQGFHCCPCSNC